MDVLGIVEAAFGVGTEVVLQPGDIDVPFLRAALDEGQRFLAFLAGVAIGDADMLGERAAVGFDGVSEEIG